MSGGDQAAGLRRWAETLAPYTAQATIDDTATLTAVESTPTRVLMVVGLPGGDQASTAPVVEALQRWHAQGQRWVGDPLSWRVVPTQADSPHLAALVAQQRHWALWVGRDGEAFRRSYRLLKQLAEHGGPRRLLLVHPPLASRSGLLANLQQAAAGFLGFELWIVPATRRQGHEA
ncbi:hypothetical protein [Modicisalibacter coralii]|uniref:hypothetical protein n=1 Tax=Modicisalibacter coralii TaxID=2304602 RepID=UPI00100A2B0F|nr:hypothetical protein [Halomonas coralii]